MKIGIVTQSLGWNYGGILQNYALQTQLKRMGHEVYTINHSRRYSYFALSVLSLRNVLRRLVGRPTPVRLSPFEDRIGKDLAAFVCRNITLTTPVHRLTESVHRKYAFEAYIVGSDQVWRPRYNKWVEDMYLRFVEQNPVRRIAYAASFGGDEWEYTPGQTVTCRRLAQKFDLVTVREESGVELCAQHLNVAAQQVPDPTLLLTADDYSKLVDPALVGKSSVLTVYGLPNFICRKS